MNSGQPSPSSLPSSNAPASPHRSPRSHDALLAILSGENRTLGAELARAGLAALTPLYALVIGVYRGMYDVRLLHEVRLPCPVFSIGNLTVGGTGKTGLALTLARLMRRHGLRPAVLNYGYHAAHGRGPAVVSDGEKALLTPEEAGDEAAMLAGSLPGVPVLIGKRRIESGALAVERFHPDALILDDGFQYWRLARDANLVLLNATEPWGYNALLPRGLLRELPAALRRATGIVLTHTAGVPPRSLASLMRDAHRLAPNVPLFEANYRPARLHPLDGERGKWENGATNLPHPISSFPHFLKSLSVGVLSGLGSPIDFERSVASLGASEIVPYRFPDHHSYREDEVADVLRDASMRRLDLLVTTAKDAIKLRALKRDADALPLYVLESDLCVEPEAVFERWIMEQYRTVRSASTP